MLAEFHLDFDWLEVMRREAMRKVTTIQRLMLPRADTFFMHAQKEPIRF